MKKYLLPIVISFFFLVLSLIHVPLTFAAGETWTWLANGQIQVSGGNLSSSTTLPYNEVFNLVVKHPNVMGPTCVVNVTLQLSKDKKSAVLNKVTDTGSTNFLDCLNDVNNLYWGTTIQIGGTPTSLPAVKADTTVSLDYQSLKTGTVTFTITNTSPSCTTNCTKSVTVTPTTPTKTDCGAISDYLIQTKLDPGTYRLTAANFPPHTFKKDTGVFIATYYDTGVTPGILLSGPSKANTVNVSLLVGLSQGSGPFTITLKGPNNYSQSLKTTAKASANTGNCQVAQAVTFCGVPAGTYSLCTPGLQIACQNVTKTDGQEATATINGLSLDPNVGLGTNGCLAAPTPLPPPPSPPCKQWSGNGVCQTFGSTFGGFSTDPQGFVQKIFAILLSVSGGIALLLIMKAGYQLMTAQGNPEKLNNGREQLVAAIVGLVFLIFSFVFLELLGFDILHIPGFGGGGGGAGAGTGGGTTTAAKCNPSACVPLQTCQGLKNGTGSTCNTNGCPAGSAC